jgi:gamma-glutamyltranspeptidase/glutathione hydrolase
MEAMRCAFADTLEHCGDPEDFNTATPALTAAQLVDKAYAAARAAEAGLNPDAAAPGPAPGHPGLLLRPSPDTAGELLTTSIRPTLIRSVESASAYEH